MSPPTSGPTADAAMNCPVFWMPRALPDQRVPAASATDDIVARVMREEQSVSALARRYAMSFAAVQKHVAVLERAALVSKQRRGREQIVHGNVEALRKARRLIVRYEQIWRQRAQSITDILTEDHKKGTEQ